MQQGLLFDTERQSYYIRELEVSIHNNCNLQCNECGFLIPHQIKPYIKDPISEIVFGLNILKKLQIHIPLMVVVGGEPLLNTTMLENAVKAFKPLEYVDAIEVVSNGLFPQGLSKNALHYIDQITISKYFQSDTLVNLWKSYIAQLSPKVQLNIRENTENWDKWWGDYTVDSQKAQQMYDQCFYRRHCVTIERGRLFSCSRIAKEGKDAEGLRITEELTFNQIEEYLNSPRFLPSCLKCTPMMAFPTVKGGVQPDNRIEKLVENAIHFLKQQIKS